MSRFEIWFLVSACPLCITCANVHKMIEGDEICAGIDQVSIFGLSFSETRMQVLIRKMTKY